MFPFLEDEYMNFVVRRKFRVMRLRVRVYGKASIVHVWKCLTLSEWVGRIDRNKDFGNL
jgi:hypothetical protein